MALSQSVASELLEAFRAGEGVDLIRESVRLVMQELIETEAVEHIGAGRYERTESRVTDRNGSRPRLIATQAGDIELRIPKLRNGSFFPAILEPRRRIDQALYAVVMEAYVNGVSTRAVDDLVTALGVESGISKSEVSRICAGLDEQVEAFRSRPLHHTTFPYVFLDATYLHVRRTGQVTSMAVVVATGVTPTAVVRCSVSMLDSEDEVFWRGFLRTLKQRGLTGVRLVISDQHTSALSPRWAGSSKVWGINAAGCTSSATCSRSCPCRTRTWLPRCSEPSSPNPTPKPWPPPGTASATSWPPRFPRSGR
jgi:putative transposase